jgi:hypothetical protein
MTDQEMRPEREQDEGYEAPAAEELGSEDSTAETPTGLAGGGTGSDQGT